MAALFAASLVVLGIAAGVYWFAYRLYGERFFFWAALAWASNAIYVGVDTFDFTVSWLPDATMPYLFSLPAAYCFYFARCGVGTKRLFKPTLALSCWTVFILAGMILTNFATWGRFITLTLPGTVFEGYNLLALSSFFASGSDYSLLRLLRGSLPSRGPSAAAQPFTPDEEDLLRCFSFPGQSKCLFPDW